VRRSRNYLPGFYAAGPDLSALVPAGLVAIDAGANVGIYTYWIARSASEVVAFEPQRSLAERLATSRIRGLTVHNCALSDRVGLGELHIPRSANGEASLGTLDGPTDTVEVRLSTVDSFELTNIGFFKIDVEGHEEALLRGAEKTLSRSDASVYIEIEERHNPGGLARIVAWLGHRGYVDVQYRQHGAMHPFSSFDLERDQLQQQPQTPAYANNFLFTR
jgi:FkbM family methyltransferase